LDQVVGSGRLPDFEDRGKLPFVECVLQETIRWYPIAPPLVSPHRSLDDDLLIPKGSVIIPNVM
ncbi:hypothetical protein BKA93DRAFT_742997, partial [Sparassis latifolia]